MKKLIVLFLSLAIPALASGQTFTAVTANNVMVDNGSGTPVNPPSGSNLCFLGVNSNGAAITYNPAGEGPISGPVCQTFTSGGNLSGAFQVANSATASPAGVLYTITITNGSTTYLTIPKVSVSGSLFNFGTYAVPGNGTVQGIGFPHIACNIGAQWTSTTISPGASTCSLVGSVGAWISFPNAPYCPAGQGYITPQVSGQPFCISPSLAGTGAPTGSCLKNTTYFQQDAVNGAFLWGCVNSEWQQVAGSGGATGLTSFQGRTTPAATLQSTDITGILSNSPFGLSGSGGLLFDSGAGIFQPSPNWNISSGVGPLNGKGAINLSNGTSTTIGLNNTNGSALFASGNFTIGSNGSLQFGGGLNILSSNNLCQSNGTNCPTFTNSFYQLFQNNAANLTQRNKANFITSTGIVGVDNPGNASSDVSLNNIPNASLTNSSITINVTGSASGGGVVPLGGSTTINVTGGGGGGDPAGTVNDLQIFGGPTSFAADSGFLTNDSSGHNFHQRQLNNLPYPSQYQTGSGNNGIANASGVVGQNNTLIVDNGDAGDTEFSPIPTSAVANKTALLDLRSGGTIGIRSNNTNGAINGGIPGLQNDLGFGSQVDFINDTDPTVNGNLTTGGFSRAHFIGSQCEGPGINLGSPWAGCNDLVVTHQNYRNAIASTFSMESADHATGDHNTFNIFTYDYGGNIDGSGEGDSPFTIHQSVLDFYVNVASITATTGLGDQTPVITVPSGHDPIFPSGGYVLDTNPATTLTGSITATNPWPSSTYLSEWTMTGVTLTPDTGECLSTSAIGGSPDFNTDQVDTLTCTVQNSRPMQVGFAWFASNLTPEQVTVTSVSSCGANCQTISVKHHLPQAVGSNILQGGTHAGIVFDANTACQGMPLAYTMYGSADATHGIYGFLVVGLQSGRILPDVGNMCATLTAPDNTFHGYPLAQVQYTVPGSSGTVPVLLQNDVNWQVNDPVIGVDNPAYQGHGIRLFQFGSIPNNGSANLGIWIDFGGASFASSDYNPFRITNANNPSLYVEGGGNMNPPEAMLLEGEYTDAIQLHQPLFGNGGSAVIRMGGDNESNPEYALFASQVFDIQMHPSTRTIAVTGSGFGPQTFMADNLVSGASISGISNAFLVSTAPATHGFCFGMGQFTTDGCNFPSLGEVTGVTIQGAGVQITGFDPSVRFWATIPSTPDTLPTTSASYGFTQTSAAAGKKNWAIEMFPDGALEINKYADDFSTHSSVMTCDSLSFECTFPQPVVVGNATNGVRILDNGIEGIVGSSPTWSISNATGNAVFSGEAQSASLNVASNLVNGKGLQVASATACAMPSGVAFSPASVCTTTISLPAAEPDTLYSVSGCIISGTNQIATHTANFTTTSFTVDIYAVQTGSMSGGTVSCLVSH